MNRRQALIGLASATAAAPIIAAGAAKAAAQPDRSVWDRAYTKWRAVDAEHERLGDAWEKADDAADDAVPRIDRFFEDYDLDMLMPRTQVEGRLQLYNARSRLQGKPEIDKVAVAEEFMAYREQVKAAKVHHRTDELYQRMRAHIPTMQAARDEFMAVPAPDTAALLIKMEVSAISLDDEHAESCLADARRLLSNGRA